MDLRSYQRQMCLALKKYLNLVSSKRDNFHEKAIEREYLELLREIIFIHEGQKSVISALRGVNKSSGDSSLSSGNSLSPPSSRSNFGYQPFHSSHLGSSLKEEEDYNKAAAEEDNEQLRKKPDLLISGKDHAFDLSPIENNSQLGFLKCAETMGLSRTDFSNSPAGVEKRKGGPPLSPWKEKENLEDDIHDLVTAYEFMQSLGLLTIKECEEVLKKRRERHKKNALSHVFCQAIWEKQETKRKKRDWLLSSSPPQLRRKIRPGSQPPSRQPSRPSSPAEGGSSSPTSSLSPPSPASPGIYSQNSQTNDEICPLCKGKGASFQCDGCGVLYHSSCVDCPDEESDYLSEWLCSKCEKLGLRASTYTDPLHQKIAKEDFIRKDQPLTCKAEQTQTKKNKIQGHKRLKDSKERNAFQIKKFLSFCKSQNLIDCSTTALSLAPSLHLPTDTSSNTPASLSFRMGNLNPRSVQKAPSTPLPKSHSQTEKPTNRACSLVQNLIEPQNGQSSSADEEPYRALIEPPPTEGRSEDWTHDTRLARVF